MTRRHFWIVLAAAFTLAACERPYIGKWKLNPAKSAAPSAAKLIEFDQRGSDGLTVKIASLEAICEAKFDGKDYPATGPSVPTGYTLAVRKINDRSFEMVQKVNGRALYTSTFTASADGKTLTETDSESVGRKVSAVYDRQ